MKKHILKIKKNAFTLIELVMAIALSAMITVTILFVFQSGLDSWIYGQTSAEIQEAAALCQHQIIEGSFVYDGMREIIEIVKAEETSLTFIPWWEQKELSIIPNKKIALEHDVSPLASLPIGEVWSLTSNQYELVNLNYYPKGEMLNDIKNYISFPNSVPKGRAGRIFFYPEYTGSNEAILMQIYWDHEKQNIFRKYRGEIKPIYQFADDIKIVDFKIEYLNGANEVIPLSTLSNLTTQSNPITAIRDFITVKKGDQSYTLRSFVNIRKKGIASEGTMLTEGASIPIPNSKDVKTLSLINFLGVKENSFLYCTISSKHENKSYGLKIYFTLKNDVPWIRAYEVEYPKGNKVFTQNADIPASRGINLLTLDYSGMYDYSIDSDIQGQVIFSAEDIIFTIIKSSIRGVFLLQK